MFCFARYFSGNYCTNLTTVTPCSMGQDCSTYDFRASPPPCPHGFYCADATGSAAPSNCSTAGAFCPPDVTGLTSEQKCPAGFFCADKDTKQNCPDGSDCTFDLFRPSPPPCPIAKCCPNSTFLKGLPSFLPPFQCDLTHLFVWIRCDEQIALLVKTAALQPQEPLLLHALPVYLSSLCSACSPPHSLLSCVGAVSRLVLRERFNKECLHD